MNSEYTDRPLDQDTPEQQDDNRLTEPEVDNLVQAVKDASAQTPLEVDPEPSYYWLANTMAPLNAVSAVSYTRA
jgi:hypothetical protein